MGNLEERMSKALREEDVGPSDAEVIEALANHLGRPPTADEVGRVFALVERTARDVARVVLAGGDES